ncbi:MAG: hypothetical protein ACYCPT_01865 [Acidimicrobiales bacterium]
MKKADGGKPPFQSQNQLISEETMIDKTDEPIDTTNWSGVSVTSHGDIVILIQRSRLSRAQALNLAAYLVVLADGWEDGAASASFTKLVNAIRNA